MSDVFFDDPKRKKTESGLFGNLGQGIVCAILAAACFSVYRNKSGYIFGAIFLVCAALRFWLYMKKKKRDAVEVKRNDDFEDIYDEYDALIDDGNDDDGKD